MIIGIYEIIYVYIQKSDQDRACCRALSADCLSCAEGITIDEYCANAPDTVGCPGDWIVAFVLFNAYLFYTYIHTALQIQLYNKSSTTESEGSGYEEESGYEDDENNLESPGEDYRCVFKYSRLLSNLAFYQTM